VTQRNQEVFGRTLSDLVEEAFRLRLLLVTTFLFGKQLMATIRRSDDYA
jgi:hypothetical protein